MEKERRFGGYRTPIVLVAACINLSCYQPATQRYQVEPGQSLAGCALLLWVLTLTQYSVPIRLVLAAEDLGVRFLMTCERRFRWTAVQCLRTDERQGCRMLIDGVLVRVPTSWPSWETVAAEMQEARRRATTSGSTPRSTESLNSTAPTAELRVKTHWSGLLQEWLLLETVCFGILGLLAMKIPASLIGQFTPLLLFAGAAFLLVGVVPVARGTIQWQWTKQPGQRPIVADETGLRVFVRSQAGVAWCEYAWQDLDGAAVVGPWCYVISPKGDFVFWSRSVDGQRLKQILVAG